MMSCIYYIDNNLNESSRRNLQRCKEVELYSSGILDLRTKLPGERILQASIATPSMSLNPESLIEISVESKNPVYLVPERSGLLFDKDGYFISAIGENAEDIWQYVEGWPMPQPCFSNGFPFAFDMEAMWKADIPVKKIPVNDLTWSLDYPWWESESGEMYSLRPRDVLQNIDKYPKHRSRIDNADQDHPLIVGMTQQGRWLILDGMHRFVKLLTTGADHVQIKKFDMTQLRNFIKEEDLDRYNRWCMAGEQMR